MKPARIGIFGGTFDPPHVGHQLVVQDALEALALDRVVVVPAGKQPLKLGRETDAGHRLAMAIRCFEGIPGVDVDSIEVDRGGISFMVDTVEVLRGRWRDAELHLLVGEDVVATLPQWREPVRILSMVRLVVLRRGGHGGDLTAMLDTWKACEGVLEPIVLATRRIDISSTEVRKRLELGRPTIGFLPEGVRQYIDSVGLYPALLVATEGPGFA